MLENIDIKVSELSEAPNPFFIHEIELFIAKSTEKEWVLRNSNVVHCNPNCHTCLIHHAKLGSLISQCSNQRIIYNSIMVRFDWQNKRVNKKSIILLCSCKTYLSLFEGLLNLEVEYQQMTSDVHGYPDEHTNMDNQASEINCPILLSP